MGRIRLNQLSKRFGDNEVLRDVNLTVEPGEFCVLLGSAGSGKSTLLRMIAGLEDVSSGKIEIDGVVVNDIPASRRDVAMVFENYAFDPNASIYDNIAAGLKHQSQRLRPDDIERRVREAAQLLNLDSRLDQKPRDRSGGRWLGLALARAIARQPRVYLLDESLANLDLGLHVKTRVHIRNLLSASALYATHDQAEAMNLADKIVVLRSGTSGSSVAQVGSPRDIYHQPTNRFVAQLVGQHPMNFFDAHVLRSNAQQLVARALDTDCVALVNAEDVAPGETVTFGIRPEHISIGHGPMLAKVMHLHRLDDYSFIHLKHDPQSPSLLAKTRQLDLSIGDEVAFSLPPGALHVFKPNGMALARHEEFEAG